MTTDLTCEVIERDDVAEQYVLGTLPEEASIAFEEHYFSCARCFGRVRVLEEARGALADPAASSRRGGWRLRRIAAALGAAAVVVLAVWASVGERPVEPDAGGTGRDVVLPAPSGTSPKAGPDLARLGAVAAPPYEPRRLRGAESESARLFRRAMREYQAGQYDAAAAGLVNAAALDPLSVEVQFYLGVCELMMDRDDQAVARLRGTIAAGESPYLEDAHFLLAKALIRQNDLAAARRELQTVINLSGERRADARRLLGELRAR